MVPWYLAAQSSGGHCPVFFFCCVVDFSSLEPLLSIIFLNSLLAPTQLVAPGFQGALSEREKRRAVTVPSSTAARIVRIVRAVSPSQVRVNITVLSSTSTSTFSFPSPPLFASIPATASGELSLATREDGLDLGILSQGTATSWESV